MIADPTIEGNIIPILTTKNKLQTVTFTVKSDLELVNYLKMTGRL
jgi:hypothetical protein